MKKLLLATLAVAALSLASLSAQAAATTATNFTVQVVLTPTCVVSNDTTQVVDFGTYTAITGGASTPSPTMSYKFTCTRQLAAAPTLTFDGGTAGGSVNGVIAGLNYTLSSALTTTTPGTEATAAPVTGTATAYVFTVTGNMPANQPGNATVANSAIRTIVVNY